MFFGLRQVYKYLLLSDLTEAGTGTKVNLKKYEVVRFLRSALLM